VLVDSPPEQRAETAPAPPTRRAVRAFGLLVSVAVLVLVALASIAIGAKGLSLEQVWHGLFQDTGTYGDVVVDERLSRTVLGLLAGAALGLSGAVLQALTRNPLADPGLLGVSAGAAFAIVFSITVLGVGSLYGYIWLTLVGALAATAPTSLFARASGLGLPGAYGYGTGTSFAAPAVAGAAALVMAANRFLDAAGVARVLEQTASGHGRWARDLAYGTDDVAAAVDLALG